MKNIAIIIPSRLSAKRLPNKPLEKINGIPMIVHVLNRAKESKVGEVIVATPDEQIIEVVKKNGGQAILTTNNHSTGSDRVYEIYSKKLKGKVDIIINLQGDMPNIKSESISKLEKLMKENNCDIGTLASVINDKNEINDPNVVKVKVEKNLKDYHFLKVKDFFREKNDLIDDKIYHHIGIYAFTSEALTKYVKFAKSKLEIERNLEQMRALENGLVIKVGLSKSAPLGVDTIEDLKKVTKQMKQ
jgi:3-deoxy-manno-octulosonate cytidylyltransferase (CMP-KDO synthetase)